MRVIRTIVCSLLLAWRGTPGHAGAPAGPACHKEPADKAFSVGMKDYADKLYREAIPDLADAARFCPRPREAWPVHVKDFGDYPFLPYYFLGKSYYRVNDRPSALRNLYLSACVGEPSRDTGFRVDIATLTRQCRDELSSSGRPDKHPDFGVGFNALDKHEWDQAAERMWNALLIWDEDGGTTFSAGRWPDIYLPRYQLAEALLGLGCEREACEQFDRSLLRTLNDNRVEKERKRLAELASMCAQKKREPYRNSPVCERWRCWLQQKGSTR